MKTLLLASLLLMASSAHAGTIIYGTTLTGAAEEPSNSSPGIGSALLTIDDVALTMRLQLTFTNVLASTTASHIHCCTVTAGTGTAGVATTTPSFVGFPLGVTSGSMDQTYDMTLASSFRAGFITANGGTVDSARAALLNGLASGTAYLNIHTSLFPAGEIRGFLAPVPEPGTVALMLAPLAWLAARRRRS